MHRLWIPQICVFEATSFCRFDILLWPSEKDPRKPMDPKTHYDFLKAILKELGINTTKVGHAFRPAAALEASLQGYVTPTSDDRMADFRR